MACQFRFPILGTFVSFAWHFRTVIGFAYPGDRSIPGCVVPQSYDGELSGMGLRGTLLKTHVYYEPGAGCKRAGAERR